MRDVFVQAEQMLARMSAQDVNPFSRATIMDPWTVGFVDVPEIHGAATREIESLIKRVKREGKSKGRLLIGDSATGKSHVLARIKNLFSDRAFFCFSEPLTGDGDNVFQHILSNVSRNLLRAVPDKNHPQFHRVWRDFFLGVGRNRKEHEENFRAWTENRKFDFMCQVDDQLRALGKNIDFMLVGVLYEYARNYRTDTRVRVAAENWCRCVSLNEEDCELLDLPSDASIDSEDKAKELVKALGVITSFSRPIFLCFDQVETYLVNDRAFKAFMRAVEFIVDYTCNYAVVTAALLTFDEKLRTSGFTPSTWDRFNCASRPITIYPLTPDEGEKLIEARLRSELGMMEIYKEKRLFPFCGKDLDEILTPPGASTRTYKQARYILEDAESVFDGVLRSKPTADEIELHVEEDAPLRRMPGEKPVERQWPDLKAVSAYLNGRLAETLRRYEQAPDEVGIDENRNRDIIIDLLLRAVKRGTEPAAISVVNVTVFNRKKREGCDFAMTLSAHDQSLTFGVICCDDARANVVRSLTRKASQFLKSNAIERLIYLRDARAALTQKGRQLLVDFRAEFSGDPARALVYGVNIRALQHLRAMRRLFELAAGGDLTMYHPRRKKEHRLGDEEICRYLLDQGYWLENELISSLITGGNHPGLTSHLSLKATPPEHRPG